MSDTHTVVCDTVPGEEGYARFSFGVTCDQALAIWNLCRDAGPPVRLNGEREWVEVRPDGHVGYVNERQPGAGRGSILTRASVIAAMRGVRELCRDGDD